MRPKTWTARTAALVFGGFLYLVSSATAEDRIILGKKVAMKKSPTSHRVTIKVIAYEEPTDLSPFHGYEPIDDFITIILNADAGGASSYQSFTVGPGEWKSPIRQGHRFRGSERSAVKRIYFKVGNVFALVKIVISGFAPEAGKEPVIKVFPPDPNKNVGFVAWRINGTVRYCSQWGDTAGGVIRRNDGSKFSITRATSEPGCLTVCGDGLVGGEEQCDDGNTVDGDCCSSSCGLDSAGTACDDGDPCTAAGECDGAGTCVGSSLCGDGNVDTECGEECDTAGESQTCDADCTAVVCGDMTINATAGEECEDGSQEDGDGCSSQCLCNPVTTPDVCDLTGEWADDIGGESGLTLTVAEDTAGNSIFSGAWSPYDVITGESSRSDSCGIGTITLTDSGVSSETYNIRSMVHDSCDAVTAIIEDSYNPPFTIERVTSPSAAFLHVTSAVLD